MLCEILRFTVLVCRIETFFVEFFVEYYYRNDAKVQRQSYFQYVKYKEVLRIYAIRICLILGLLMNAKNKKCMTTHLTKGIVVRSGFHADLGSSHYLGAEYLVFVSSRSLKTREKYTNLDNFVCLQ